MELRHHRAHEQWSWVEYVNRRKEHPKPSTMPWSVESVSRTSVKAILRLLCQLWWRLCLTGSYCSNRRGHDETETHNRYKRSPQTSKVELLVYETLAMFFELWTSWHVNLLASHREILLPALCVVPREHKSIWFYQVNFFPFGKNRLNPAFYAQMGFVSGERYLTSAKTNRPVLVTTSDTVENAPQSESSQQKFRSVQLNCRKIFRFNRSIRGKKNALALVAETSNPHSPMNYWEQMHIPHCPKCLTTATTLHPLFHRAMKLTQDTAQLKDSPTPFSAALEHCVNSPRLSLRCSRFICSPSVQNNASPDA